MTTRNKLILPALRGVMGDWVFYTCLMNLREIGERIRYANEIHKNKNLSDMIQRRLKTGRSKQIAEYIETQDERFFNSLVVATYDGEPSWHSLSDVRNRGSESDLKHLTEETIESIGFLALRGDEKLFALDGQHRLSGIKLALKAGLDQDPMDDLSVIFVAHKKTAKGLERTRRLFTTLNKTARPVSKGDIVALDEDDAMAICTRWLIEKTGLFRSDRIAFVASNNMPATNVTSLTTIVSLYDILTIMFTKSNFDLKRAKSDLQRVRPCDEELENYFKYAKRYFQLLKKHFSEIDEFFSSTNSHSVVQKYRGRHGGSVMFRPIGLDIYAEIIAKLSNLFTLTKAVKIASQLPRDLTQEPYLGLMWNESKSTILNSHKVTLREVLLYMVGHSKLSDGELLQRYRKDIGNDRAELPNKVASQ